MLQRGCLLQAEKKVKELQNELDDLSQRLDEAGGATQAQVNETHTQPNVHPFTNKLYGTATDTLYEIRRVNVLLRALASCSSTRAHRAIDVVRRWI